MRGFFKDVESPFSPTLEKIIQYGNKKFDNKNVEMPCSSTALPKPGQYLINLSLVLNTSRTNWGKRTCCVQPIMALPKTEIRSTIHFITKQSKPSYYSRFAAFPTVRPTLIKDAHCKTTLTLKTITSFFGTYITIEGFRIPPPPDIPND